MLQDLLDALRPSPRTLSELRHLLKWADGQVESALLQLRRGGYVDRAIPEQGACYTGCGHCSLKNFCPSTGAREAGPPTVPSASKQEIWRLTDKALSRVAPPA